MTFQALIDRLLQLGREITTCEIPVLIDGVTKVKSAELSQDNNGNYYLNLNTKKND